MLVVQVVELVWTKASRGAAGGARRAEVQRALPIDLQPADGACLVQRYRLEAGNGFQPKLLSREALQHIPGKEGHLRIHADGHDRFLLGLAGNPEKRPPPGWQEATGDYGQPGHRSIADVVDDDSRVKVREYKKAKKAAAQG